MLSATRVAFAALIAFVFVCLANGPAPAGRAQTAVSLVPLESLTVVGRGPAVATVSVAHPVLYRGRKLARGLEMGGDGSFSEYRLGGQYGTLFGKIFVEDAVQNISPTVTIQDNTSSTPRVLFHVQLHPRQYVPIFLHLHGVDTLVVRESACPGCTAPIDVVATLATGAQA